MLSRDVCKKCRDITAKSGDIPWDDTTEDVWRSDKKIICPVVHPLIGSTGVYRDQKSPPPGCPYVMEHAVSEAMP
jgi:hypothetical protein